MSHDGRRRDPSAARLGGQRGSSAVLAATLALAGCGGSESVFVRSAWPSDQVVVIVVARLDDVPIGDRPHVFLPGEPARITIAGEERVRLFAFTFDPDTTAPDGSPLAECGVAFGGEGLPLPEPRAVWSSSAVDPAVPGSIELAQAPEGTAFDLRHERCNERADPCEGVVPRYLEMPDDLDLRGVVVLSDDLAYFSGERWPRDPTKAMVLGRIDRGIATLFAPNPSLRGDGEAIVWDGTSSFIGRNNDGGLFRFDLEGTALPAPRIDGFVEELAGGTDGTMLAILEDGHLFELTAGSTVARERTDLGVPAKVAAVVTRDRIALADTGASINFFDGASWHREHVPTIVEAWSAMGGDSTTIAAAGGLESFRLRDEDTKRWEELPRPFDTAQHIASIAPAGPGRFLAVSFQGGVAMWDQDQWCVVMLSSTRKLRGVSVSPSRRIAYAVGTEEDGEFATVPPILELTLPPPRPR